MKLISRLTPELFAQFYTVLAIVIFLVSGILYLTLGYLPIIHQDFWLIYDVLLNHSWWKGALLRFNGHSLFFPALIWQANLHYFHGSQALLFFIGLVFLSATCGLLILPIWKDPKSNTTAKLAATLILVVGNFWMARAYMIESGAFSCSYSLTMMGAALAFLYLPAMRQDSSHCGLALAVVIASGVLATFSFGSGVTIWPALLILGWSLRLPLRAQAALAIAMVCAGVIYGLLPPHNVKQPVIDSQDWFATGWSTALGQLCRLIGSPISHAATAWREGARAREVAQNYPLAFWGGVAGVFGAIVATLPCLWRRDLRANRLQTTGLALLIFNFLVFIVIVLSRNQHFRLIPNELGAPRYVFWSSLFWAGLLLLVLDFTQRRPQLRWLGLLAVLSLPILTWPDHIQEGFHWRFSRLSAQMDAISLINGVNDPEKKFFPDQKQVERVAAQLRAKRLDLFAAGLQDWIGQPVSHLFHGQKDSRKYRGHAGMSHLQEGKLESAAVRVTGNISPRSEAVPEIMVIIDSKNIIAGIARVSPTSDFLNRLLYDGRMPTGYILGYVAQNNPSLQYLLRAAGKHHRLSQSAIGIAPLPRR